MNIINNSHGELQRLNEEVLKPGDIVLVTQRGGVSSTIRALTLSDISHAMVYIEDSSVIDTRPGGVRSANTHRMFFSAYRKCVVCGKSVSAREDLGVGLTI